MKDLYPPSSGRSSARLGEYLEALVHDTVRIDPDSRHYHATNPVAAETERIRADVRRMDPRPWSGDVRQAGSVQPADDIPSAPKKRVVYGPPSDLGLVELRRYQKPSSLFNQGGHKVDSSNYRIVEQSDTLLVEADDILYQVDEFGGVKKISSTPDQQWRLVSSEPGEYLTVQSEPPTQKQVAGQINGLSVTFAGRGLFDVEVEFTGVVGVTDGSLLSEESYLKTPLKLYDENGKAVDYHVDGDTIDIDDANTGDKYTLYYQGLFEKTVRSRQSARLDQIPQHSISLEPIAEKLNELPSSDDVTCIQSSNIIARVRVTGQPITATEGGYIGNTYVGHKIHHVLPGNHYVVAIGGDKTNSISITEPESQHSQLFGVPSGTRGITWTESGLLGVVVEEEQHFVVYGIDEIREFQAGNLQADPTFGPSASQ